MNKKLFISSFLLFSLVTSTITFKAFSKPNDINPSVFVEKKDNGVETIKLSKVFDYAIKNNISVENVLKSIKDATGFDFEYTPQIQALYKEHKKKMTNENSLNSKIKFADNLKKYDGNYDLTGFGFGLNSHEKNYGKAIYTYLENPDGSRIYEGKFGFYSNNGKSWANGYFKNDRQVGLWIWDAPARNNGQFHCEINFNENGIPDGDFEMTVTNTGWHDPRSYCIGKFVNGRLEYLKYKDDGTVWCDGHYKNGHPVGEWTVGAPDKHLITMVFNENGTLIKGGYRDERTGDWINGYSPYPESLLRDVSSFLTGFFYRYTSN